MSHNRFVGYLLVAAAATAVSTSIGVAVAPPAVALPVERYIEVAQCQPGTGQTCDQVPAVPYTNNTPSNSVQAFFTANSDHCSDIDVRFLNDGYPQGDWVRVAPGQTVSQRFLSTGGTHQLGVFARGVEGGCNTGVLQSWGGMLRLVTSA